MSNAVRNSNHFQLVLTSSNKNYSYDVGPGDVLFNPTSGLLISFYLGEKFYILHQDGTLEKMKKFINGINFKSLGAAATGATLGWGAGSYDSPRSGEMGAFIGATAGLLISNLPSLVSASSGYYHAGSRVFDGPKVFDI